MIRRIHATLPPIRRAVRFRLMFLVAAYLSFGAAIGMILFGLMYKEERRKNVLLREVLKSATEEPAKSGDRINAGTVPFSRP